MRISVLALPLALALGACAEPGSWTRDSTQSDRVRADLRECRAQARTVSRNDLWWREEQLRGSRETGTQDRFSPVVQRQMFDESYRAREDDLTADCMQAKGYTREYKR